MSAPDALDLDGLGEHLCLEGVLGWFYWEIKTQIRSKEFVFLICFNL